MALHVGERLSVETAEMGVLRTESETPKTKARMSVYVGDARKTSWSRGESMRRMGMTKLLSVEGSGNAGVSGAGSVGAVADGLRARGTSFGSFCCASGGSGAAEAMVASDIAVKNGGRWWDENVVSKLAGKQAAFIVMQKRVGPSPL